MKKFSVKVKSVSHFIIEAETAAQAEAMIAERYAVTFDDANMDSWDSWDEYNVTEVNSSH